MSMMIEGRPARFTPAEIKQDETSRLLRLLASPTRRAILRAIDGRRTVREIQAAVGITQALASHDVSMMRLGGLVERVPDGHFARYVLTEQGARVLRLIEEFEQ